MHNEQEPGIKHGIEIWVVTQRKVWKISGEDRTPGLLSLAQLPPPARPSSVLQPARQPAQATYFSLPANPPKFRTSASPSNRPSSVLQPAPQPAQATYFSLPANPPKLRTSGSPQASLHTLPHASPPSRHSSSQPATDKLLKDYQILEPLELKYR